MPPRVLAAGPKPCGGKYIYMCFLNIGQVLITAGTNIVLYNEGAVITNVFFEYICTGDMPGIQKGGQESIRF